MKSQMMILLVSFFSLGAFAKPVCLSLTSKGDEIPKPLKSIFLRADTEKIQSEFEIHGVTDKGEEKGWGPFQCVSSTTKKSKCRMDDDGGSFEIEWTNPIKFRSKFFALEIDEGNRISILVRDKKILMKLNEDDDLPEFTLKAEKIACPPESRREPLYPDTEFKLEPLSDDEVAP